MKRVETLVAALVALPVLLGAGPAWAHEEISPSTFPVSKPAFLTITAANEKQVRLTKLTVTAPQGLDFGGTTHNPAGWTSTRTDTAVTWTGGALDPDRFESFGFEIEGADRPGTLTYKATLGYADGSSEDATVPVTAVAAGASGSAAASSGSGSDSGSGRANVALGLAAAALALAVASLARGRERGRGNKAPATPSVATETDW
jgi:hypothetical protein